MLKVADGLATPFVKWVGGKTKLIPQLSSVIDGINKSHLVLNYIEPFIGGGALYFYLYSTGKIRHAVINDVNEDLILCYKTVRQFVRPLIHELSRYEQEYLAADIESREVMFYKVREEYNQQKEDFDYISPNIHNWVARASKFIFLNKTCFNGLYRQNSKGCFNVPFGRYATPRICDQTNLVACSVALQHANILCGDFETTESLIDNNSLVYLDPPYKPLNKTSSFTKYHKGDFNDLDQIRLAEYYRRIDKRGARIILSNSDPKSVDDDNDFFDELYHDYEISRVSVSRTISAASSSRGKVQELIIKNVRLI